METLDDLMQRQYETTVLPRDGGYFAYIAELGLVAEGKTPGDAFDAAESLKRQQFERMISIGKAGRVPLPRAAQDHQIFYRQVKPFLFKAAVTALIGVTLIVAANISIVYTIRESPKYLARTAVHRFIGNLDAFAKREITPEREKKIHALLQEIVPRLKPFARDLAPLFEHDPVDRRTN